MVNCDIWNYKAYYHLDQILWYHFYVTGIFEQGNNQTEACFSTTMFLGIGISHFKDKMAMRAPHLYDKNFWKEVILYGNGPHDYDFKTQKCTISVFVK